MTKNSDYVAVSVLAILGFCALVPAIIIGWTWLQMWAWNLVIAGIFHGPTITFWQSFAVSILLTAVKGVFTIFSSEKGK